MGKRLLAAVLAGIFLLSGCGGGASSSSSEDGSGTDRSDGALPVRTDFTKYNAYADAVGAVYCLEEALEAYYTCVDRKENFAFLEGCGCSDLSRVLAGLNSTITEELKTAEGLADQAPAYPDADETIVALSPAALSLADTLLDLKHAANEETASALHRQLTVQAETFETSARPFLSAMSELELQTREEELTFLQRENRMISYWTMTAAADGQMLTRELWSQMEELGVGTGLNLTEAEKLYQVLSDDLAALRKALADPEQRKQFAAESDIDSYEQAVDQVEQTALTVMEQARADQELCHVIYDLDGTVRELVKCYNSIAIWENSMEKEAEET